MTQQPESLSSTTTPPAAKRRRRRWPVYIAVAFLVLIVLGGVGFVTASALEEHDTFCTFCHTIPETTYFNRAYLALDNPQDAIPDLATAHYHLHMEGKITEDFKCINCHRGDASLGQRISTLALAGRDSITYVLGKENPTAEKTNISEAWLPNAACVTCHTATLLRLDGINNHFHNFLPQAAAALAKGGQLKSNNQQLIENGLQTVDVSLLCSNCHLAHKTVPNGKTNFFMTLDVRNEACIKCHLVAKKGPQDVNSLPKQ